MHWPFQPDRDKGTRREGWGHKDTGVCVCMQAYLCVCTWHVCVYVSGCVCVSCYHGHLNQPVHPVLLSLAWYNQLPTPKHPLTTIPHSLHLSFSPHPSLLSSFVGFCHCATPSALSVCKKVAEGSPALDPRKSICLWERWGQEGGMEKCAARRTTRCKAWGMQVSLLQQWQYLLFFAILVANEEVVMEAN